MAIAKITLNGTTLMNATDVTATADDIIAPATAMIADGTKPVGTASGGVDYLAQKCNGTLTSYESDEVTKLFAASFRDYTPLVSIKLPNLTQVIGNYALMGTGIQTLSFQKLQILWTQGFANMKSLKKVDLGPDINKIYIQAFASSTVFDTLIIRKSTPPTLDNISAFNSTPFASGNAGGTLYVPQAAINSGAYTNATNWSTILGYENNSIQAIEGSIYENAYADGTPIT